jgi:acetyl/propionyl-CoA carboxylase alpha subunit
MKKLLIANRGEIAVRIMRTAAELGVETVAVYSQDDDRSLHVRRADSAVALAASGAAAYLDGARLVGVATAAGCDALHPGYGFLSESAALATACEAAGLCFVGPAPAALETLGDKVAARALARECGVPVLPGTPPIADVAAARAFLESLGSGATAMVKAVAGGGGRGMRAVDSADALESALRRCRSEAEKAFGNGAVYLEKRLARPRHVEVQIAGDGSRVVHLGERDCSIQRRHQKVLEIAPAPGLDDALRRRLCDAALRMAAELSYRGVGTFEFLVDSASGEPYFIEANARLQVEHTVTEEVTGIDLVAVQLRLAGGCTLAELGLGSPPVVRGYALQMRVNAESIAADGSVRPRSGRLEVFDIPSGHGVRTDTAGYVGYAPNPGFDSLLAKVVAHCDSPVFDTAARKALRALRELRVLGIETNQSFVERILRHPDFVAGRIHTDFVDDSLGELLGDGERFEALFFDTAPSAATVGARIDVGDPLAGAAPRDRASARRARTSPTSATTAPSSSTARWRWRRSAAARAPRRGADRAHAGRRPGGRHRPRQRRPCSRPRARAASCSPTTTRCSPAPRACRTTARRTACSSSRRAQRCRWCSSPRAAAAGRATPTARRRGPRLHGLPPVRRAVGLVPLVGINSGRCFAGNAALLGCCDVIIATAGLEHRHGRPGDDRRRRPRRLPPRGDRPMDVQVPNGVVDIAVADEAEAVAVAKRTSAYFQGPVADWECADQRLLRTCPREPPARLRRARGDRDLADTGSVLELRRGSAPAWSPRWPGRGPPARHRRQQPAHLGGAIDSDGADKAARFMQLCDAFDLPILFLCDTPGIMVGPEVREDRAGAPRGAHVRHRRQPHVPFFTIVLRKGYGLGAQAMAGGSFKAPLFTVAWPTGEFGGMGLEGAVKLGFRKELAAIEDPPSARAHLRGDGRAHVRARQGAQHGLALRDRRRHRPGRSVES